MKNDFNKSFDENCGQKQIPLFSIPLENVVPPPLHLMLGLGQDNFDALIKYMNIDFKTKVEIILEKHRISPKAYYKKFTGKHLNVFRFF